MMNLDNYYLHATGSYEGVYNGLDDILLVLKEGKLLTRIDRQISTNLGLNNDNELCFCDPSKKKNNESLVSSFSRYIERSPALVFPKSFEVFTPKQINPEDCQDQKGTTDLYDEVRHIGSISLENLKFVTFPIWPIDYIPEYDDEDLEEFDNQSKLKQLNIFFDNIAIIESEFKTVKMKDIYTGIDLNTSYVKEKIKIYEKELNMRR